MTDVTHLGDIWVNGHRRPPGGSFPGGGGGSGDSNPDAPVLIGEPREPTLAPETIATRCDDPIRALEVNADAAMAEAARQFRDKARELGDDGLYMREFHAFLYLNDSGQVIVGEVAYGERVGPQNPGSVAQSGPA